MSESSDSKGAIREIISDAVAESAQIGERLELVRNSVDDLSEDSEEEDEVFESSDEDDAVEEAEQRCFCEGDSNMQMVKSNQTKFLHKRQKINLLFQIRCDNDDCPRQWFHFSCVGIKDVAQARAQAW